MGKAVEVETTRYKALPYYIKTIFLILVIGGLTASVFFLFGLRIGEAFLSVVPYHYLFAACFLTAFFLAQPARKNSTGIPWYDFLAAALSFGLSIYFFANGEEIAEIGWIPPTPLNFTLAVVYSLLILEATRRTAGYIFVAVCLVFGLYPLFASHMPGPLFGIGMPIFDLVGKIIFGNDGLIGMPLGILDLVVGFMLFAAMLIRVGAAEFFLNLALALLGKFRGGPAKVAVVGSAFFGTFSGSPLANIVGTGSFTIPAMKRLGFEPHFAGAVEACASTGGILMPPVMGAMAFVMAAFLGVDYSVICKVAAIPAILYFFGLLMQVDAYAARWGLKGLPREEIPPLKQTLKDGWIFIIVLAFLVWGLMVMRWGIQTPFYASGLLFLLSFQSRKTMMTPRRIIETIAETGKLIAQVVALMAPLCFIMVGIISTGLGASFTSYLVGGEGSVFVILIVGVVFCYVLGMAGIAFPAYVFLAVSVAPALVKLAGLNELAVHLFIIYYTMLAGITPPAAPGSFLASVIAGASPMKTAVQSMRLGVVIYLAPIFFVFNPALTLQGPILDIVYLFALALLGILFIAAGFEGYLVKVGQIGMVARPFLVIGGFLIAFPQWNATLIGAAIVVLAIVATFIRRKRVAEEGN